jgi:hypothetical protein
MLWVESLVEMVGVCFVSQIKDAVRMAEMMARKKGAGEPYTPPP